ncbi:hypothetical protein [Nocardia acidivorans]|uniref:hypothetical protein n=1 Tax=Nocardia acidivorans TaxID=404580 RepID=UPI0008349879|nr:hypothetical protein [Nocardia acidivorans]
MILQNRTIRTAFAAAALAATLITTAGQAAADPSPQTVATSPTGSASTGSGTYFLDKVLTYLTSGSTSCNPLAMICGPIG